MSDLSSENVSCSGANAIWMYTLFYMSKTASDTDTMTAHICTLSFMTGTSVSMSFRVWPQFKGMLEIAAARESRSLTNMLETLLFTHCARPGIKEPAGKGSKAKGEKHA